MKRITNVSARRSPRSCRLGKWAILGIAMASLAAGQASFAQTAPANLSPDLQEIVKFAQAHMSDDVILAYIKNSGKSYNLSADDLLYLNSQGVSQPVISALLKAKGDAPAAPAPAPSPAPVASAPPAAPPAAPPPAPEAPPPPPPGLADNFGTDAGLNPGLWAAQTPLLSSLAQFSGAVLVPPGLTFGPAGMQMSGVAGPGQLTGVQSVASFTPPFKVTATVSGRVEEGIPFDLCLVSPDLRQWLSVAGHLGGAGERGGEFRARVPFVSVRIPTGHAPSPEHGTWVNWTGSGQPLGGLGNPIYPAPRADVPYTITMTVGADGIASVVYQDPAGVVLGSLNAMPVGNGPFNVVLASRGMGPTFANWYSVNVESLLPPPAPVVITAPPETPTIDYFQAHLSPYGQWITIPDAGAVWVPQAANDPDWRPYFDAGHWEYTDAGWFWQSDYPWGDIAFHYGRWIKNVYTGDRWAWAPGYNWAPSWVVWRDGDAGMGWAPLPWGVEFHPGVGLFWHGAVVTADVDFGIGVNAFVFVGHDHFWGGNYRVYAFDPVQARICFEHSSFHAGYVVVGGHLHAEGLGRDRVREVTHHDVEVHAAIDLRRNEEHRDFAKRTEEHHNLARVEVHRTAEHREVEHREAEHREASHAEPGRPEAGHPEANRAGANYGQPGSRPGEYHPGQPTHAQPGHPAAKPGERAKGQEEKKEQPQQSQHPQ